MSDKLSQKSYKHSEVGSIIGSSLIGNGKGNPLGGVIGYNGLHGGMGHSGLGGGGIEVGAGKIQLIPTKMKLKSKVGVMEPIKIGGPSMSELPRISSTDALSPLANQDQRILYEDMKNSKSYARGISNLRVMKNGRGSPTSKKINEGMNKITPLLISPV
jgi:hypothetical protein